ncbi:MAG: tyrosine-type recombinase/integrase [Acidimicrobiales bacterium]
MSAPRRDPANGTWWFIVDLPPGGDGKRRQAKRRGFRTKADAQAALDELRVGVRKGTYIAPARQTLGAYLTEDWLPAIRTTIEPSTHESYARYLRLHVIPAVGGVPLQQLDAGMLNRLYADLLDHGRKNGQPGGLSARTVRYIHTIIGRALREAVAWDRMSRNVAQAAQPPGAAQAKSPEMKTWDAATLARFLDLVRDDRHQPAWLFLATTGCRRGEALGLRWADVDLAARRVVLYQTVSEINHELRIAPRTKSGKPRPIELDAATVAALSAVRRRQAQERLLLGPDYVDHDLVFARPDGHPEHPEHFSNAFERRVARYRLPRIRLHDLRHTWATLAQLGTVACGASFDRVEYRATIWDLGSVVAA